MAALGELLSFARSEEERLDKIEREKQLFPLWLANYALARLQGNAEIMDFEAFIAQATAPGKPEAPQKKKEKRTAEEILAEFAPIVEADKKRGG